MSSFSSVSVASELSGLGAASLPSVPTAGGKAQAQESVPTRSIVLTLATEESVTFTIADGSEEPPRFCLGVRKSGSTMLNRIVVMLARYNHCHPVDIAGTFFRNGYRVRHWDQADLSSLIGPGNVYVGFRSLPTGLSQLSVFWNAKKVFMFRDPRDALVSQYFSDAFSHVLPDTSSERGKLAAAEFEEKRKQALDTDINDYVVKHARNMGNTMLAYAPVLDDPNCLSLRYEEYVFQKRRLIYKILQHFGWAARHGQVEAVLKVVDQVPTVEDKTRFIRRVIPGDHRDKLKPETIQRLNQILRDCLKRFDYY